MINLAVFASGSGSNALSLMQYLQNDSQCQVCLVVCNNPEAGVLKHAEKYQIPVLMLTRQNFKEQSFVLNQLADYKVDKIVLAGFLWLIPAFLIQHFRGKMINLHPSLLPKYGGKGMYGMHVHQAVFDNNEKESGITLHEVNEEFDKGKILFQAKFSITKADSVDSIFQKIRNLEASYFSVFVKAWSIK